MAAYTGATSKHLRACANAYAKALARMDPERQERLWREAEKVTAKPRRKSGGTRRGRR